MSEDMKSNTVALSSLSITQEASTEETQFLGMHIINIPFFATYTNNINLCNYI